MPPPLSVAEGYGCSYKTPPLAGSIHSIAEIKYKGKVLFPEKLAKANDVLKRIALLKMPAK